MYRTSNDMRFIKNREALRRTCIDRVKEKGTGAIAESRRERHRR